VAIRYPPPATRPVAEDRRGNLLTPCCVMCCDYWRLNVL